MNLAVQTFFALASIPAPRFPLNSETEARNFSPLGTKTFIENIVHDRPRARSLPNDTDVSRYSSSERIVSFAFILVTAQESRSTRRESRDSHERIKRNLIIAGERKKQQSIYRAYPDLSYPFQERHKFFNDRKDSAKEREAESKGDY